MMIQHDRYFYHCNKFKYSPTFATFFFDNFFLQTDCKVEHYLVNIQIIKNGDLNSYLCETLSISTLLLLRSKPLS